MNRTFLGLAAAIVLAPLLSAAPASADIVANGSFETGDFTGWTLASTTSGATALTNATDEDFVFPDIGYPYDPEDGSYLAMLGDQDGGGAAGTGATLTQTISYTANRNLFLTYYLASDGYAPNDFSVKWNNTTIAASVVSNLSNTSYTEYQFLVMTVGTTDTLQFIAGDPAGYLLLDNVSLVPEPASIALFGSGLLVAGVALRRRWGALKA